MATKELYGGIRKVKVVEGITPTTYLRKLSGRDRDKWVTFCTSHTEEQIDTNPNLLYANLVILALCDENGKRTYSDNEIEEVYDLDGELLQELFVAAKEYCLDSISAAKKNSSGNTSVDGGTGSQEKTA